jgi:hypothetical protein
VSAWPWRLDAEKTKGVERFRIVNEKACGPHLLAGSQFFSFLADAYAALRFTLGLGGSWENFLVFILHFTLLSALSIVD